jgi:endo-1,4-beta-xylanase
MIRPLVALLLILLASGFSAPAQGPKRQKKPPAPFQWVNALKPTQEKLPGLRHATFRSPSMKVEIGYCLYLPPGYDQPAHKEARFPVIYLLHGGRPGSEGKLVHLAEFIDKAMRAGQIPPTIYVFNNGGPVSHYDYPGKQNARGKTALVKELIPHIDKTYRTIATRAGRSIEGYSQGGRGTLRIALEYPELFHSASAGSAGVQHEKRISENKGHESDKVVFAAGDDAWTLARNYAKNKKSEFPLRLLLYTGNSQKDFNYEANLDYSKFLKSIGIPHETLLIPDVSHSTKQAYQKRAETLLRFHAEGRK